MINSVFTNDPEPFGPIMSYIDANCDEQVGTGTVLNYGRQKMDAS